MLKIDQIKTHIALLLIIICIACNQKESDKTYLADYIHSVKENNSLTENPLLVIDGYTIEYETMIDVGSCCLKRIFRISSI